jgi:glycosyltransferase involved in cell wall biosynthesis
MRKNKVLVLVPSYNHGKFIKERIDSILGQDFQNYDLLIIDDASSDDTADYLSTLKGENLTVRIREENSGSPFTAWADAATFGDYDYIWIAESDDVSYPEFLSKAISSLESDTDGVLYYTNSWYIDQFSEKIGHTLPYLRQHFSDLKWDQPFQLNGLEFNNRSQIYGNAVPNMSSAVMRMASFRASLDPSMNRYKLAADWFFVGRVASTGNVHFDPWDGNQFRQHGRTSRAETNLERRIFEYYAAIMTIGHFRGVAAQNLGLSMKRCTAMFLHERASVFRFIRVAFKMDPSMASKVIFYILSRTLTRPDLLFGAVRYVSRRMGR